MQERFARFADAAARWTGASQVFVGYLALIALWLVTGPALEWSNSWQLLINTPTTVVTVAQVILISHTQHRDSLALQAKLDELLRSSPARNELMGIELSTSEEIQDRRPERSE